jgi:hypothetical protein
VDARGQRFLVSVTNTQSSAAPITLLQHWQPPVQAQAR